MSSNVLETITSAARRSADLREAKVPLLDLERTITPRGGAARFAEALAAPGVRIIAECKRRSPSRGILREAYDPAAIASSYQAHGAAAISVLTEPGFFDGLLEHLSAVRAVVDLPVLRKDFIVTRYQVAEAAARGADAVLLIVAALDDPTLQARLADAAAYGLAALVEVHAAEELDRALHTGARIVGVNSRNLRTLEVDTRLFETLGPRMPAGVIAVAESGLKSAGDLVAARAAGFHACLMGERFMTASDPGVALADLRRDAEAAQS